MAAVNPIYHPSNAPLVESVKNSFRKHWKCNPTLDLSLKRRQVGETDYAGLVVAMLFDDSNPKYDVAIDGDQESENGDSTSSKDNPLSQENRNQNQDPEPPTKTSEPQAQEEVPQETVPQEPTGEAPVQVHVEDVTGWERVNGKQFITAESFDKSLRRGMRKQPVVTIQEDNYPWAIDFNASLTQSPFNQLWNHYVAPADKAVPDIVSVNVEISVLLLRQLYSQSLPEDEQELDLIWRLARDIQYSARAVLDTLADGSICPYDGDGKLFRNWISTKSVDPLDLLETREMNADFKGTPLANHMMVLFLGLYDQLLAVSYLAIEMRDKAKGLLEALRASEPKDEDE